MNNINDLGLNIFLSYEDPRYPLLIIQGEDYSLGYSLNVNDGTLSRVCICSARESFECGCGAWEEIDAHTDYDDYDDYDDYEE